MSTLTLTPIEARVVAALAEKTIATPQYVPMSVNALMLAANQKTCRQPVMALTEGEVGAALNHLEELSICARDTMSSRVTKWRQSLRHQLLLNDAPFAVLITLMLRGPQTAAELRANAAGVGGPADTAALDAAIQDLSDRAQPLVTLLPRAPGRKEARYAHLLCGEPQNISVPETGATSEAAAEPSRLDALEERVRILEEKLAALAASQPEQS